jgi:Domain of Unknown Function (DUF1080)
MLRFLCVSLPCSLFLLLPLPATSVEKDIKLEPGFEYIFNGKNLDGWKEVGGKEPPALDGKTEAYMGRFKVADGKLIYDPAVKGDKYIETAKAYGDVQIRFDFKAGPKCNNDVLFRGTKFDIVPGNKENKTVKEGEWSTFELIAVGDKIEHKINNETVRTTALKVKSTPFKLRAEFGAIEIKNIRAKGL